MGIIEDAIGCARDTVFDCFADDDKVQVAVTYTAVKKGSYNPTTGVNDSAEVTDSATMIRTPVSNAEVEKNEEIWMGDRKYLARISDFTNLGPDTFREDDTITDDSDVWRVIMVKLEPTEQLAIFWCRKVTS